jgi:hypothetical protein
MIAGNPMVQRRNGGPRAAVSRLSRTPVSPIAVAGLFAVGAYPRTRHEVVEDLKVHTCLFRPLDRGDDPTYRPG